MGFIVGLNRDRDSYQVPLALAELGQLELFVTDYYEGVGLSLPTLGHRKSKGIAPSLVRQSHRAFLAQMPYEVKRRIDRSTDFPTFFVERQLGKTIAHAARKNSTADLLLYSGSAKWAFEGPSTGKKILFQYHPSPEFIVKTLHNIDELAGVRPWQEEAEALNPAMQALHAEEVALADSALCASTFTKQGLIAQGMPAEKIAIAPYGGPEVTRFALSQQDARCNFLFVGQGIARKGLHHLIEAWRRANLQNSTLTVVASRLDPEIEAFAEGLDNFELKGRVDDEELKQLMQQADTFVLPSLVEGFGLVLSEALAQGCRLIASSNTGLVDMQLPETIGTVVTAGSVDSLVEALQEAEHTYNPARPYMELAFEEVERLSWKNFRSKVQEATLTTSERENKN